MYAPTWEGAEFMAQQGTKHLEQESVSPFEKFKDLTKKLLNVRKEELQAELEREEKSKRRKKAD